MQVVITVSTEYFILTVMKGYPCKTEKTTTQDSIESCSKNLKNVSSGTQFCKNDFRFPTE